MSGNQHIQGYAAAIFEVARAEGRLQEVEDELFSFARTLESSADLRQALEDPRLDGQRKRAILSDLLEGKVSTFTQALIGLVVDLGRATELPQIVDEMVGRAAAERNKAVAEVRSATPLDSRTIERLAAGLSKATGRQVDVKLVVDPSVIGGLSARVGNTVIDGSVRRRLEMLRERLQRVDD